MAIPIFEDELYDNNNNHNYDNNNNNVVHHNIINQGIRANNYQRNIIPAPNPNANLEEDIGFLNQLVTELQAVFSHMRQRQQQPNQHIDMVPLQINEVIGGVSEGIDISGGRDRRRRSNNSSGESGNRVRNGRVGNMQDNQNPTGLPDIISCHLGASLRINNPSSPILPTRNHWDPQQGQDDDQDELRTNQQGPFVASRNGDESDPPSDDDEYSSFGFDFKVQMSCSYRTIGTDLRQIADNYELQNDRQRRRRHPAERQTPRMTSSNFKFEFSFALKVAIPAVTLVGLGLAYLRRSS